MSDTSKITIDIDARIEEIKKLRDEGKKADGLKKLETLMNEINDFATVGRQNRDNRLIISAMRAIAKVTREIPRGSLEEVKSGCFSPSDAGDVEIEKFLEEDNDNIVLTVEGSTKKLCIDRTLITRNLVRENLVRICKEGTRGFRFIDNKYLTMDGETKEAGSKELYFKMKTIGVFESAIVPMKQVIGFLLGDKETREFKLKKVDDDEVLMLSHGLTLGADDFTIVDQINTAIYDQQVTTEELPANLQELLEAANAVSAAHCQEGQEATKWDLARSDGTEFDYESAANSLMEEGKEFHNVEKYDNSGFDYSQYAPNTPDYPYDLDSPNDQAQQVDSEINVENYVKCVFIDYFKKDGGYESYMLRLTGEPESAKDKMYHIFGVDYTENLWNEESPSVDLEAGLQVDAFMEMLVAETNEIYASNASLRNKTLAALSSSRSRIANILEEIKRSIESKFRSYYINIMDLYPEDTEKRYDFLYNIFDDLELDLDCSVLNDDGPAQQLGNMFDDAADDDAGPLSLSELDTNEAVVSEEVVSEEDRDKAVEFIECVLRDEIGGDKLKDPPDEESREQMKKIALELFGGNWWKNNIDSNHELEDDWILTGEWLHMRISRMELENPSARRLQELVRRNPELVDFVVNLRLRDLEDVLVDDIPGDGVNDENREKVMNDMAVLMKTYMSYMCTGPNQTPTAEDYQEIADILDEQSQESAASTPRSIASARTVTPEPSTPVNFPSPSTFSGGKKKRKKRKQTKKKKKKKKETRRVKFNLENNKYYTISRRKKKKKRKTRSKK